MRLRLTILLFTFFIVISALVYKLFYWQVIKGSVLAQEAQSQHQFGDTTLAPRGNILASDGTWLAASTQAWLVYASKPDIIDSPRTVANKLAPLLVDDKEEILPETER